MTLYSRGDIWWAYVTLNGVRHCRSTGTGNKRLAQSIERKFHDELTMKAEGLTELKPEMTFGELSSLFLATSEVKPHHTDRLKMLLPFWEDRKLCSITRADVRAYRDARMRARKLTETTVNRDLEVLRHLLFFAVDEGFITANPLARLRMSRPRKRKRPILSWNDEQKLIGTASPHLSQIIVAALDTGMRRGEILRQDWADIDWNRGLLSVTHSKTAEGEAREIPLTSRVRAMLGLRRQPSGPVFTFHEDPINRIKTGWAGAIRRSGIERLRFHDLRHTFNTRLLDLGVLTDVRKALMGHSSGEDVHSIYTHVEMPLKRKAIAALDGWIAEQIEQSQPQQKEDAHESR